MTGGRRRGGQPGNHNAMKHGFYAHGFTGLELDELLKLNEDLSEEVQRDISHGISLDGKCYLHIRSLDFVLISLAHFLNK